MRYLLIAFALAACGDNLPPSSTDAGPPVCGSHVCACADGIDNDADGYVDLADPDCTSPADDSEASL